MAELKALMEKLGYTDVRTVLASGNVRFSAKKTTPEALVQKLESAYAKKFGFDIGVIVRSVPELEKMAAGNPFKSITVTPATRRYVTLLSEKPLSPQKAVRLTDEYAILKVTPGEVYSVLEINPKMQTPDVMKLLGKSYGKKITTRNWNTVQKILAL